MRKRKNGFDELPEFEEEYEYTDDYGYEEEEAGYADEDISYREEAKPRRSSGGRHVKPKARPSRKKRLGRGILIGILALVLIVVIAAVILFNHMYGLMNTDKDETPDATPVPTAVPAEVTPTPEPAATPTPTPEPLSEEEQLELELHQTAAELVFDEDVYNLLLIGSDSRKFEESARTDSMILVSINKRTKELWLTSLQRDIYINIAGWGGSAKLNAANVYGGMDMLIATIEEGFGVNIDNYAMVNFDGFIDLAEMAGGITVTMTADEIYYMNLAIIESNHLLGVESNDQIIWDLVDGTYHLNGKQTLGYCRIRALDGDTARAARQRAALMQMWGNIKKMGLMDLYKMAETAMGMVTTDLTKGECASLLLTMPSLLEYEINTHQLPVEGGFFRTKINEQSCYWLDFDVNRAYLRATVYGQDVSAQELTSDVTGNYVQVYYPEEATE